MNTRHEIVLEQLITLITQGNAHATFEEAIENVSMDIVGIKPENIPYSIWMLVEHIRITQQDILDFSSNADYKSITWPDDYWPGENAPENEQKWWQSVEQIKNDRNNFIKLLTETNADLYTPFEHGEGQNLLREALLIADHTSYHTGQIILVRKLLKDWNK